MPTILTEIIRGVAEGIALGECECSDSSGAHAHPVESEHTHLVESEHSHSPLRFPLQLRGWFHPSATFPESHYSPHPVADALQTPDPDHHFVTCPETGQLLHAEGAEVHKAHAGYHAVHVHDPSICGMDDVCDAEHVSALCAPADQNMR